ncbi:MAG: nicotinate (nicotinamide) nucleotide adenylyltransferase [Candidatus Wallbacteria bacterium]
MRVGIFGGTFNPIHYGHLRIAECAVSELALDKFYFLPTNVPPHKDSSQIIDIKHRKKMVLLAIEGNHFFDISDIESGTSGPSYTTDTIDKFAYEFTGAELYFLTGADTLKVFHNYKNYKNIINKARLVVAPRPGSDFTSGVHDDVLKASIFLKKADLLDISSTKIRDIINSGGTVRYLLPEPVNEYILTNGLYCR